MKSRLLLLIGILFCIVSCDDKIEIECPNGYSGANCEIEDICITQELECLNGGVCIDGSCECPNGYSGTNCEIENICITQELECLNGGICIDGSCDCPDDFLGVNCQFSSSIDIQEVLDDGIYSPYDLFLSGIPLDSLYGKLYEGGLIFYLDIKSAIGYVAAPFDQSNGSEWGCKGTAIIGAHEKAIGYGAQNTIDIIEGCSQLNIAAKICNDLELNNKIDWFLPSIDELELMYQNLHLRGYGEFNGEAYWSSTEASNTVNASKHFAWIQYIGDISFRVSDNKDYSTFFVRAARQF